MINHINFFQRLGALGISAREKLLAPADFCIELLSTPLSALIFFGNQRSSSAKRPHHHDSSIASWPPDYRKHLQSTVEYSQDIIVVIDTDYNCIAISQKGKEKSRDTFGFPLLPGMNLDKKIFEQYDGLERIKLNWEKALSGEKVNFEEAYEHLNEEEGVKYKMQFHPVFSEQKQAIGAV